MDSMVYPLEYKGHPLFRKDTVMYYGSMAEKYVVMLQIKDAEDVDGLKHSKRVSVELQLTDPEISSKSRVVKSTEKSGIYDALDVACVWLSRALSGKI